MSRTIKNQEKYVQKKKIEKEKLTKRYLKFKTEPINENLRWHNCPECGMQTFGSLELPYCNYCEWDALNELEVAA